MGVEWWIPQVLGPGITFVSVSILITIRSTPAKTNMHVFILFVHQTGMILSTAIIKQIVVVVVAVALTTADATVRRVYNHFSDATHPLYNFSSSIFCLASHVRWHTSIITGNASAMLQFRCVPATIPL